MKEERTVCMRNDSAKRITRSDIDGEMGYLIDALVPSMMDMLTGDETKQLLKAIIRDLDHIPYNLEPLTGNAAVVAKILAELANVPGLKD